MNNSYQFHPAINKKKAFACTPPPDINASKLLSLPTNWLAQLNKICRQHSRNNQSLLLYKHVNEDPATYLSQIKKSLLQQLKIIYYRLTGQLDSQLGCLSDGNRTLLLSRLIEDIDACTEGFHNRVNHIVSHFSQPSTLSQLLYEIRKNMVEMLAFQQNDEVHSWNFVNTVASRDGLGIKPNLRYDANQNDSSMVSESVRVGLQKKFRQEYTPFYLPFLLQSRLLGLMTELGYNGRKEKGDSYKFGDYERMALCIKTYLPDTLTSTIKHDQKYFIVDQNGCILDINWFVVRQYLYQALIQTGILKKEGLQPNNLFDYACYRQLFSKDNGIVGPELDGIDTLFKKGQYPDLIDQLSLIQSKFPDYYKTLSSQYKGFHHLIFSLILSSSLEKKEIASALKLLARLDWALLTDKEIQPIINALSKTVISSSSFFFLPGNMLMIAIQYYPEAAKTILGLLEKQDDRLKPESLVKILGQKNSLKRNALILAINHHPETARMILDLLEKQSHRLESSHIEQCLGGNINQLIGSVLFDNSHPETAVTLIKLIAGNRLLQSEDIQQLLIKKDSQHDQNILMSLLTTSHQPEIITEAIFNLLNQQKKIIKPEYLLKFLEQKNSDLPNKFILASCCPESMTIILRFMAKHPTFLEGASLSFRNFILDYLFHLDAKDPNNREIQDIFIQSYLQRPDSIVKKTLITPENKKEAYQMNSTDQLAHFFRTKSAAKSKIMANEKQIAILERARSTMLENKDKDETPLQNLLADTESPSHSNH